MKVAELIEILQKLPPEYDVIIGKDSEGNYFSPCSDADVTMYEPESTWSGEIRYEEDCEEAEIEYKPNAVVIWPIN